MTGVTLFFDVINITLALALVAALQYRFSLNWWVVAILLFHFALIFLTNGVLFPPSYMPDQFKYLRVAQAVRGAVESVPQDSYRSAVDLAGYFFGFFPLPIMNSIYSIAIINFILYLVLFVILLRGGELKGLSLWFFLLYPSLLLYTSLSLRDTLVLFFMLLGVWLFLRGRLFWSFVVQLPLAFLKLQNLGIFAFSLFSYYLLSFFFPGLSRRRVHPLIGIGLSAVTAAALPLLSRYGLMGLNLYRHKFWLEDLGLSKLTPVNPATQIGSFGELIVETFKAVPYALFKPLPWEAQNALQLLQSAENLIVGAVVILVIWMAFRRRAVKPEMSFLLLFFFVGLAVYGLTVWNFGTAVRYKFPYVTVFLVFFSSRAARQDENGDLEID